MPDGTPCAGGECKAGTCVITADAGTDAGTDGAAGSGGSGATGTGGASGSSGAGGSSVGGTSGNDASTGTGGTEGVYVPDQAGCNCRVPAERNETPGSSLLAGLAAALFATRRTRRRADRRTPT